MSDPINRMEIAVKETQEYARSASERLAEEAGYDAGINGPNTTNTHFKWFTAPHLTKAWERGKKRALDGDSKP